MATQPLVYIGDLPSATDEAFLRSFLQEYGTIAQGAIILKKHKSLDKAFAFVTFDSHENAARAIQELNYTKLDGVPIRMSWSDPETKRIRQSGLGNLFIRGLDESIEVSHLHEAFSQFGEIISCKIPLTDGKSRGYGYIQFKNPDDAEKARMDLADASINGKQITIEQYTKQAKKNPDETFTNVIIKPLPAEKFADDEDLKKFMESMGEVQSVKLVKEIDGNAFTDKTTGKMTVFGFCNYMKHEDAVRATQELVEYDGEKLVVCRAMTRQERMKSLQKQCAEFRRMKNEQTKGRCIDVRNFNEHVTEEEFKEFFSQFGEVESAKIAFDAKIGVSLKYGYVLFVNKEDAEKCIRECPSKLLNGDSLLVSIFKSCEECHRENAKRACENDARKAMTQNGTPKNGIKQYLQDKGISGQKLKEKLVYITDEQAQALLEDPEMLEKWSEL